ncbi:phosphate uptake regulator, PhoU [Desulforamulus reducens MI-1]|uniref:Phosphate-specific transport system accessory protein PhoU n=1 Tax=Desulforamulus reducens (strain ATCC BAA-1160 / DSM 100696 / MI-1) TaxID=349161 RepID=A4J2E6_DESRM|nr:phosphate signaling complex protein PhoU [Desulforamulus reducens]ABO49249.1 phosphate uptake regulator, PhoU [Desulforamulus reducens MI-1]
MTTRQSFDKALADLQQDVLRMASVVEKSIFDAVKSLATQDPILAGEIIEGDDVVDEMRFQIEDKIIKIIATQQPMAKDLRILITGIRIIISLERMADHSVDIARVTMCLAEQKLIKPLVGITAMAKLAQQMVKDGLDAYVNNDPEKAREMCAADDEVDHIYHQTFKHLVSFMKKDPDTIGQATYLLFVARFLERIADHATNIGEAVIFQATGEWKELN